MIEIEKLVKYYGSNLALDGISFSAGDNEIVGFLGPNGAGKSTAMNIITGYLSSNSGSVKIGGIDIFDDPDKAKLLIGYLPEIPPLYPDMTVEEYLDFVYDLKKCTLPRKAHLSEITKVTKTELVKHRLIANLSKGYRQRVGIAQALVGDPKVIIFDEPTVGLDPNQIIEIRTLIRRLGRKHTVILSTHILSEVQAVCDRIVIIENGRIIANEKADEISSAVNRNRRYSLKICGPTKEIEKALGSIEGAASAKATGERDLDSFVYIVESEKGYDIRKSVFRLCAENGWDLIGFEPSNVSLEEVFIKLTDHKKDASASRRNINN